MCGKIMLQDSTTPLAWTPYGIKDFAAVFGDPLRILGLPLSTKPWGLKHGRGHGRTKAWMLWRVTNVEFYIHNMWLRFLPAP